MIKGKTTIELTDINTGAVEKITSENMLTNFAECLLTPYGFNTPTPTSTQNSINYDAPYKSLFGGILCFEDEIPEDANGYFPPADNKMIANGCVDVSSTDAVTEFGSYNEAESGVSSDGKSVTFTYDYGTSQANGTISCVCLASYPLGYIGTGNSSNQKKATTQSVYALCSDFDSSAVKRAIISESGYTKFAMNTSTNAPFAWVDIKNNELAYFQDTMQNMLNAGAIKVDVYPFFGSKMSVIGSTYDYRKPQNEYRKKRTITYNVSDLSVYKTGWMLRSFSYGSTDILLPKTNSNTTSMVLLRLKPNGTFEKKEFTISGWNISPSNMSSYTQMFYATKNMVYILNAGTNSRTDVGFYNFLNGHSGVITGSQADFGSGFNVADYETDKVYWGFSTFYKEQILKTNGRTNNDYTFAYNWTNGCSISDKNALLKLEQNELRILRNSLWLSTINNLDEPVTKTADKTMKITYTITEE